MSAVLGLLAVLAFAAPAPKSASLEALLTEERGLMAEALRRPADRELAGRIGEVRASIAARKAGAGDLDSALDYLRNSLHFDAKRADRWELLGDWLSLRPGSMSRWLAREAFDRAVRLEPARSTARAKLAGACLALEELGPAMEHLERLVLPDGAKPDGEFAGVLTAAYIQAGETGRGTRFLRRALKAGGDARVKTALAVLLHLDGAAGGVLSFTGRDGRLKKEAIALLKEVSAASDTEPRLKRYADSLIEKYQFEK